MKTNFKILLLLSFSIFLNSCSNDDARINPTAPVLTTTNVSNITLTNATSGGNITSDGGADITARGVVWNTSSNPTISLITKTTDGAGIGSFTSSLINLTPNTTYFVRAYATNNVGTAYGNEVTFTTASIQLPVLTTAGISNITQNAASSGGNVTSDGGGALTAKGVCWSTSTNPTIALTTRTTDGTGIGAFTSNITGLAANTTYYVRAYATNSVGTAYGNEVSFIAITPNYASMYPAGTVFCNNVVTAVVDVTNPLTGKIWMDRNLGASQAATSSTDANAYGDLYQWGRRADGHQCRNSASITTLSSSDQPGHNNYINSNNISWDWRSPSNNNLWQGINGINNPCPSGYRLPTESELNLESLSWTSIDAIGGYSSKLKLTLGGYRGSGGIYYPDASSYWSSTVSIGGFQPDGASQTLNVATTTSIVSSGLGGKLKSTGCSVRCIKN